MHCTACGYDLKAHSSGDRCPECGLDVDVSIFAEEERASETTPERFGTIVIGGVWMFCAGAITLLILIAVRQQGARWWVIVIAGVIPAIAAGILSSLLWTRYARLWATIFAWPMALWGALCIGGAFDSGARVLFWTVLGAAAFGATLLGWWIGAYAVRVRMPEQLV